MGRESKKCSSGFISMDFSRAYCTDKDFQNIFSSIVMQWMFQLFIFFDRNLTLRLFTKRNGVGWGDAIGGGF